MKYRVEVLWFCGLISLSSASLLWSDVYSLRAVLSVPAANISEPYEVWYDGPSGKARVDFYGGMDKLYRQYNSLEKKYEYFKLHPKKASNKVICNKMYWNSNEIRMRTLNTYLPVRNFKFVKKEYLNSKEVQIWENTVDLDEKFNVTVTFKVWVTFNDSKMKKTPVPVRYVYEMKAGDMLMDYFRHDYLYYSDSKPDNEILQMPLCMKCIPLTITPEEDHPDPLVDFVDPLLEHSRVKHLFGNFKSKYMKNYPNKLQDLRRLNIFKSNLRYINSVNRQHGSYELGVNHFADMTEREMLIMMGTKHESDDVECLPGGPDDDVDNSANKRFDWRDYGAITAVKDQTSLCSSCYAFATAAVIESAAYVSKGCHNLYEVSEQAIIDCTWGINAGCSGGTIKNTLQWVKSNGIPLRAEYGSYLAIEGCCHRKNMTHLEKIKNFKQLKNKISNIKDAIRENGPLTGAIDAAHKSFIFYRGGVYNDANCNSESEYRTHAVTIVGYGNEEGHPYWILKNSFGKRWGESGYMRLSMGYNKCGLKNCVYKIAFKNTQVKDCIISTKVL